MIIRASAIGKADRNFKGERNFKVLTLLKWFIMKSKLGRWG